jgi:hypothetical protein
MPCKLAWHAEGVADQSLLVLRSRWMIHSSAIGIAYVVRVCMCMSYHMYGR